jgi:hypothetical protein
VRPTVPCFSKLFCFSGLISLEILAMFQHDFATVQRVLLVEPGQEQALSALFASVCLSWTFTWRYTICTTLRGTMTMVKPSIFITFRVTDVEKEVLKKYCEKTGRQQSDVLREFVRSLSKISDCN